MHKLTGLRRGPLQFGMRRGLHGGNSALVTGLDQRVRASVRADIMSLSRAPPIHPHFQENDLSRNSPAQA
jgi:hypothetical protein